MINYLGKDGLEHLIAKMRKELRELQELIVSDGEESDEPGIHTPSSWAEVQQIVQSGLAPQTFSVGDCFSCNHSTLGTLTWQIVGFNQETWIDMEQNYSMTLQLIDPIQRLSYSSPYYLYYAEEPLPAGDYWFEIPVDDNVSVGSEGLLYFTLPRDLPQYGMLVYRLPSNNNAPQGTIDVYYDSLSNPESISVREEGGGTPLPVTNGGSEIYFGSNLFRESTLRQYLLSQVPADMVWSRLSKNQAPPEWNGTLDGFLYGIDEEFYNVMGTTLQLYYKPAEDEVTEEEALVFLPTRVQVFGAESERGDSHDAYDYYKDLTLADGNPDDGACERRIKTIDGTPCRWWLRNSVPDNSAKVYIVDENGAIAMDTTNDATIGVAPMCCIR